VQYESLRTRALPLGLCSNGLVLSGPDQAGVSDRQIVSTVLGHGEALDDAPYAPCNGLLAA